MFGSVTGETTRPFSLILQFLLIFRRQKEKRVTPEVPVSNSMYSTQSKLKQPYSSYPLNYNYPYDQTAGVKSEED